MSDDLRPASDGRIAGMAAGFWERAGGDAGFPRDPEPLLPLTLPITVVPLARLSCAAIREWAPRRGLPAPETGPDRPLRGCLLAYGGDAYLLLDPGDPPADRRFTVAHELGHYLIEVHEPRRRAARALGAEVLGVLDGARSPSTDERLDAVLAGVSLTPHVHLMTRDEDGGIGCVRVAAAECAADRFALELLAPAATLRRDVLALAGLPQRRRRALVREMLTGRYGLPEGPAAGYARELVQELTGGESVRAWLGVED